MIISKYVKIGERGQIVIPKEIREKEGLVPNQTLRIIHTEGEMIIRMPTMNGTPEDRILNALRKAKFTEKDWEEIQKDRHDKNRED
ncbi:AbrB/MazE/SpoVT family DNA-binding domain-containing protein [Candidatus Woesearchaeota archaeon]|nr:AbrB/MazE/SpoVT family DNA-binding domain-containing protein [Candidatus Woesearchaeota archaeon]